MNKKILNWWLGGFDPGYSAILARAATAGYDTTGVNFGNQNAGYILGKDVIAKLNILYIFKNGGQAQNFALLNWASTSFNADYPTAITYNSNGLTGNATDQFISTNFNCSTDGGSKYTQNSACRGLWVIASGASTTLDGCITTTSRNAMRAQSSTSVHKINQGSATLAAALDFTATNEYVSIDRLDSTNVSGYVGLTKTDTTATSQAMTNEEQTILKTGTAYGNSTIAAYFLGQHLTQAEHATLRSAISLIIT